MDSRSLTENPAAVTPGRHAAFSVISGIESATFERKRPTWAAWPESSKGAIISLRAKPELRKVYPMPHNKRILLAVDESDASRRAVDYVADMIDGRAGFHIGLVHLESPPRMLEWGGSENPEIEEKVSAQRGQTYR